MPATDTLVADTIALRYALQGVFLTKSVRHIATCRTQAMPLLYADSLYGSRVLGGGGGMDGFRKHRAALGAAAEEWLADMRKHAWKEDEEAEAALAKSVDEELAVIGEEGVKKLPEVRDLFILETLKIKQRLAEQGGK
jgi:hypothetical protein